MASNGSVIGRRLLAAALLLSAGPAFAAGDDGFAAFWAQFKTAVSKGDEAAVAQMVRYPIYYIDGNLKPAEFPKIWKGAFKPARRKCLAKQKPAKDKSAEGKISYSVLCEDFLYYFGKDDAGWKLTDFSEND
jgi:hypothetical protein